MLSLELDGSHRAIQDRPGVGTRAMGVVYHAIDPNIGRPVAIKTIQLGGAARPRNRNACASGCSGRRARPGILSHPGIVTIYDVEQQGDLAYIAMEYVDGPTLDQCSPPDGGARRRADFQHPGANGRGAGLRAPEGHRASRHQAGQHHDRGRWHGQDYGFRHRQDHRLGAVHHDRLHRGHAALHVAGAGAGPGGGRAVGPVLAGGDRLRNADRREAVHRRAPHHGGV